MEKIKTELLKTQKNNDLLVDARLLHQRLESGYQFADWIKSRINEFGFALDQDYFVSKKSEAVFKGGGHNRIEYSLTLDMAKELAMLERNDTGRMVRRYFIAVEKEAREAAATGRMVPKGVKSMELNGRKLYPYRRLAEKLGYSTGGNLYDRRHRYPNHFVVFNKMVYCTEEMANLMAMWKSTVRHRETIKAMQPVLPLGFGEPLMLGGQ